MPDSMKTMKAVDLSFDAVEVDEAWVEWLREQDVELVIANLWKGNARLAGAEKALRVAREAGLSTAAYFVVHDSTPVEVHCRNAYENAGMEWEHLSFVAINVEVDPTTSETVLATEDFIRSMRQTPALYSAWWFWHDIMKNPTNCAHLPLWDASYGITPSLAMNRPYGGWTQRIGHQYQGTTEWRLVDVDLNIFDRDFVVAGATDQPLDEPSKKAVMLAHMIEAARHLGWAQDLAYQIPG